MKNNKYKITVLSDLSTSSRYILKSAERFAQIVGGDIEIFHVRKATQVVNRESQLSAVRELKENFVLVEDKLKEMKTAADNVSEVKTTHSFVFGNLKNEIEKHLIETKPDVVVLGKKISKTPGFLGDGVLTFLLKKFPGVVLIADHENLLDVDSQLGLGFYNATSTESNFKHIDALISTSQGPLRTYNVAEKSATVNNEKEHSIVNSNIVSYVFEKNDQTLRTMSNYMVKNKVNLLLVDRNSKSAINRAGLSISEANNLVHNLKVPILLTNG
tara:strand:- start:1787 stop:2602 length:816 start_codon:yes stop_codon:yes gene_type:complete